MKKGNKSKKAGFSLIELIVVISIMAVLGMVLAPQLVRHVNNNRITACKTDREAILAVYERCIYAQTKQLETDDLNAVLNGSDATTWDEVKQYKECPSGGNYTGEVGVDTDGDGNADTDLDVAIIHCNHPGHDDVVVDFIGWDGTELAEGDDDPLDPPPSSEEPEEDEPTSEEESSSEEEKKGDTTWPYAGDSRWVGKDFPGQYVPVKVPTGLFTTPEGNTYVIIDKKDGELNVGDHYYRVYYRWRLGPEYIDNTCWPHVISWSGVLIEDIESIRCHNAEGQPIDRITGVHRGDIVVYEGIRYIYTSHSEAPEKYLPGGDPNVTSFYPVDPIDG